ncbi:hypothetical protein [Streptomyces sp. NPDC052701]|uniref:hypothetical protein n=1 Tax=Streptomyces sp. NPDC052701 TaxID=3155533 RepID=UPI003439141D
MPATASSRAALDLGVSCVLAALSGWKAFVRRTVPCRLPARAVSALAVTGGRAPAF